MVDDRGPLRDFEQQRGQYGSVGRSVKADIATVLQDDQHGTDFRHRPAQGAGNLGLGEACFRAGQMFETIQTLFQSGGRWSSKRVPARPTPPFCE